MRQHIFGLALLLLLDLSTSQVINKLEVKTADESWASMNLATVGLEIFNDNFDVCIIDKLDNPDNNFEAGFTDTFTGSQLQECQAFPAPNHGIPLLRVKHWGPDQWIPEYIRVYFDDDVYVECPDGYGIDNDQAHELDCR